MKGEICKRGNDWFVMIIEEGDWETYYPLHPEDVKEIEKNSLIFDNLEARILNSPKVEFDLLTDEVLRWKKFAKLTQI